jgi:transcriptional regulator with XRE-family HTH domain
MSMQDPMRGAPESAEVMRWLAQERKRQKLTQAQVAEGMGVSQSYIAKLERAIEDPRLSTVLRYAAVVLGGAALWLVLREFAKTGLPPPRP